MRGDKVSEVMKWQSEKNGEVAEKKRERVRTDFATSPLRNSAMRVHEAMAAGKHVFIQGGDISLSDELDLKKTAVKNGLLMMGADCETAVINGVGFGFVNRVRRGRIGIISTSGTGLQAVAAEIHNLGGGISHAIGTGSRDLTAEIGGLTALQVLTLLARDGETAVIVLIAKRPSPIVAANLLQMAQHAGKPVIVNFIGTVPPAHRLGNLLFSNNLSDAAERAVVICKGGMEFEEERRPLRGTVRGLFSGEALADEMRLGLQSILAPVGDTAVTAGHTIIDMSKNDGLHPMVDNAARLHRLQQEADDENVGIIILDVLLGEGTHLDPAAELAPAITKAREAGKRVVTIVIGTEDDPQGLDGQIERLAAAGAQVFPNVNEALDYVYNRVPAPKWDAPLVELKGMEIVNC